jgi:hypothetical protein
VRVVLDLVLNMLHISQSVCAICEVGSQHCEG